MCCQCLSETFDVTAGRVTDGPTGPVLVLATPSGTTLTIHGYTNAGTNANLFFRALPSYPYGERGLGMEDDCFTAVMDPGGPLGATNNHEIDNAHIMLLDFRNIIANQSIFCPFPSITIGSVQSGPPLEGFELLGATGPYTGNPNELHQILFRTGGYTWTIPLTMNILTQFPFIGIRAYPTNVDCQLAGDVVLVDVNVTRCVSDGVG